MKGLDYFAQAMKKSFVLKGRARRAEFGWFMLVSTLISWGLNFISGFSEELGLDVFTLILNLVILGYSLVIIPASITVAVRRFHDLGKSGWWYAAYIALIFILAAGILASLVFEVMDQPGSMNGILILASLFSGGKLIALILLIVFGYGVLFFLIFKDGQRFDNQYGEDPKKTAVAIEPTFSVQEEPTEKSETTVEKF